VCPAQKYILKHSETDYFNIIETQVTKYNNCLISICELYSNIYYLNINHEIKYNNIKLDQMALDSSGHIRPEQKYINIYTELIKKQFIKLGFEYLLKK